MRKNKFSTQELLDSLPVLTYSFWEILKTFPKNIQDREAQVRVYAGLSRAFNPGIEARFAQDFNAIVFFYMNLLTNYSFHVEETSYKYSTVFGLEEQVAVYWLYTYQEPLYKELIKVAKLDLKEQERAINKLIEETLPRNEYGMTRVPEYSLPFEVKRV